ncbi:YobI family P-loop NTPase [Capnocytophaga bilenii]
MKSLLNLFKHKENKEKLSISLAPKVITEESEKEKIKPYLDALIKAVNTKDVNNIAITGSYGSGKSTILKTFQKEYKSCFRFLNVSLASFNKINDESNEDSEKLERLLEISILQQIIYSVNPDKIPDSHFKRIQNIPLGKKVIIALSITLWFLCLLLFWQNNYIEIVNPKNWSIDKNPDWEGIIISVISFFGISIIFYKIIELFRNSKISRVSIQGEIELNNNEIEDKSIFNQYLDEIIYFFQKTKHNILIIEDLDRFENTNIFTKLREINILLNNSNLIKEKVSFIYAISDDFFTDKRERVKFFEYIIPIIPFVNYYNAEEQLKKLIEESGLEKNIFSDDFISDITLFIDDIDMRLLVNIFQEFLVYKDIVGKINPTNEQLFAIITYKNIAPEDFNKLGSKQGFLFSLLNDKDKYTKEFIEKIDKQISEKEKNIERINNEYFENIEDLKKVYLFHIFKEIRSFEGSDIQIALKNFDSIIRDGIVKYNYIDDSYYNSSRSESDYSFNFSEIEKQVNSNLSYEERKELIQNKQNDEVERIKDEIKKLQQQKKAIKNWSLKEIFKEEVVDINDYIPLRTEQEGSIVNRLLRNLITQGYINENYIDYISLFHEGTITKKDKEFEVRVKSIEEPDFNYKLEKVEGVVKKIGEKYFEQKGIFNFDLLDFLLKNQSIYKSRYKLFMKLLCDESEISLKFINEYIAQREDKKNFLTALLKEWSGFCEYIFEKSNYSMNEKYELFEQILLCVEDIKEFLQIQGEDLIKKMIENDVMYLYKPENNNPFESQAEDLLKNLLEVKIKKIENPKDKYEYLYRIICFKNYYKITEANISLILKKFDRIEVETTFKVANYTTISKSTHKPLIEYVNSNIQEYITEVYLKLPDVQQEDEYKFKELLKNENLDEEIKVQIIEKIETSISELKDLKSLPIKKSLLENKRVLPTWENIEDYYKSCQNLLKEELINFLNNNDVYSALSDKKINTSYKDLESDILVCNDISDEAYHKIIKSFEGVYESLDFKDLSENKVDYLLEAHTFSMSKNNYDTLRKSFPNKHIVLVESYFDSFLEDIDNFELDEEDVSLILNSEGISIEQKLIYIPTIEEEFILRDDTISKKIAELIISKSHKFDFSYDVIESLCKNTAKEEDKIKLIILYNDDIDNEKIKELIKSIGQEYEKIFLPKKKPCFQHTEENETLLKILRNRKLINSYKVENNNLRAIALYQ